MSSEKRLDIIVPIYRNAALVRACVDSLLDNLQEIAAHQPRLILINDSPGDEAVESLLGEYAASEHAPLILRNDVNLGFVRTVNRALEISLAACHDALLVNSDTETFTGTLAELLRAAHADPQIGFAAPRSNNASISSLPHCFGGTLPGPKEAYVRWAALSRTMPDYHFTPTAVGFYMFIAHDVLANHGSLRLDFGVGYEEENDLVMRAGKVGKRAILVNKAFAYHAGSASFNLTSMDLGSHRAENLKKLTALHPEFMPLVQRYESSPHFRAERSLPGLLRGADDRLRIVFDLTGMGKHYNGTNEMAVAVLGSMSKRHGDRIRLAGIGLADSFEFHGLDKLEGLYREDPGSPGQHGVAVRMGQPFDLHNVNVLESTAPINAYAMLDTIAEDCGPLATNGDFLELWDHVAEHANGLFFISRFSEATFCRRHPAAFELPRWAQLLPTRLSSYAKPRSRYPSAASHILVLGNHFPHKGADLASRAIASAFPTLKVVVIGGESSQAGNLTCLKAGLLADAQVSGLFADASVIVLPSHAEGFGFGFMHALAAGRPIVARRIPATEEILATMDQVHGVHFFDFDSDVAAACAKALTSSTSSVDDKGGGTWDDWADGLASFLVSLSQRDDIFPRLVRRIAAGDRLRRSARAESLIAAPAAPLVGTSSVPAAAVASTAATSRLTLDQLMKLDGREFVEHAYSTLLLRPVDESGLGFHLASLTNGVSKADILQSLSTSPEGRARSVNLPGLDALLIQRRSGAKALLRRVLGR